MSESRRERLALELMAKARIYTKEHKCSMRVALSEVAKQESYLWGAYCDAALARRAQPKDAATVILMGEVQAYAQESNCSYEDALREVCKQFPDLWRAHSTGVMRGGE
jgi:hypothetical protein